MSNVDQTYPPQVPDCFKNIIEQMDDGSIRAIKLWMDQISYSRAGSNIFDLIMIQHINRNLGGESDTSGS